MKCINGRLVKKKAQNLSQKRRRIEVVNVAEDAITLNASLLVAKCEFMDMSLKLFNNLVNDTPRMSRNSKKKQKNAEGRPFHPSEWKFY